MTIVPAYGRDYTSAKAVKADFAADKDFIIADYFDPDDGRPVNRAQLVAMGRRSVNIRFKRLTSIVVVKL